MSVYSQNDCIVLDWRGVVRCKGVGVQWQKTPQEIPEMLRWTSEKLKAVSAEACGRASPRVSIASAEK